MIERCSFCRYGAKRTHKKNNYREETEAALGELEAEEAEYCREWDMTLVVSLEGRIEYKFPVICQRLPRYERKKGEDGRQPEHT